jgi:hypothetical protein
MKTNETTSEDNIKYVDNSTAVPEEPACRMVEIVKSEDLKPWVIVARIKDEFDIEGVRTKVLKPLVLEGVLTPTASGDIKIYEESNLEKLIR